MTKRGKCEAKETCGRMRRCKKDIKEKNKWFSRMNLDRSVDNIEKYQVVKKTAKQVVSEVRCQMYDELYQWLGTKEWEGIYRMVKTKRVRWETSSKLNALRMRQNDS
jgi:hypothetical protein